MLFREIVIAGCGNPLYGDDGFGPAVVEELQKLQLPDNVKVIDAGLGAPHFLFTLMEDAEVPVKKLIIIDIADFGANPGDVTKLRPEDLPPGAYRDAHSWDLSEPLQRLKDIIDITIIGCQPKRVASHEFELGLTEEVEGAIPKTVRIVLEEIGVEYGAAINHQGTHLWASSGETGEDAGKPTGAKTGETPGE
ncbi:MULTISPECIES: coenzyme F420-reducing hydrogenase, FrhD protein [unclassified Methanoculleus]|jgi:coenzyme F420 hydrogenase subunit delta|uniref:coenzyme F420-reducing hydrogenase, FrhD protein n=1 Tax=unclassified Methanoculleus TaxID=2619537 RepID=UPI0025E7C3F5|nr:coenzyme F420-reducing hydrogenase, FrhD protein [Methanoculleus sp. UBA303]MCE5339342.1 coenzyme F420-reducing hydrogenase, FrhD protein [Methanomicrobiaceae archaeon]MDD3932712.1 coenzyme F420-reducing hydrogenase, FrhD protein [Methanoculleus sp.]